MQQNSCDYFNICFVHYSPSYQNTLEYVAHIPCLFSQIIYHWDLLLSKLENKNLTNI